MKNLKLSVTLSHADECAIQEYMLTVMARAKREAEADAESAHASKRIAWAGWSATALVFFVLMAMFWKGGV